MSLVHGMRLRLPDRVFFGIPGTIETRTGGTIYDKRIINMLGQMGWKVELLTWPSSFPYPTPEERIAVAGDLAACPDDAIILIDGLAYGALPDAAERESSRLRLVALVHHPLALETGLSAEAQRALRVSERRSLRFAREIIVTSKTTKAALIADYGVPTARITVAAPGTDLVERRRRPWTSVPHILSVGNITRRKGHDVLVEALGLIAERPWQCTIAGNVTREPATVADLKHQIETLNLGSRISLVGEVADIEPLYEAADVFALASRHEGYGMVLAEALVHGLPIVATAAGAVGEVVPPGAGILVEVDDAAAVAMALRSLIDDADLRHQLAASAYEGGLLLPRWVDTANRIASALGRA